MIVYILFDLHSEGFRVIHAMDAINFHDDLVALERKILYSILFVRQSEELCRGDLSGTGSEAKVAIGRKVAQRAPTNSATEPNSIRQFNGVSHPSICARGTVKRSYYILLGADGQGNFFHSVSQSMNIDNLRLSAAVESFRQEVSRVEEQRSAYQSQVQTELEQ